MSSLEAKIQADIVKFLQGQKVYCHSIPNEAGGRSAVMQMQLISMGLRPGVADLVVWWPKKDGVNIGYLEIKNDKGKQSVGQINFQKRCETAKVRYDLARSVEEVKILLSKIGEENGK